MADRDKYIDIIFRNGLREFEVLPPPGIWGNIQPALIKRQKHLTILRIAAVAAIFLLLSGFALFLSDRLSKDFSGPAISLNQESKPEGFYQGRIVAIPATLALAPVEKSEISGPLAVNELVRTEEKFLNMSDAGLFAQNLKEGKIRKGIELLDSPGENIINPASAGIENPIIDPDFSDFQSIEKVINKWTISAMGSPNYFSGASLGENNALPNSGSSEKPAVSYSGGLAVTYELNKRISIQSGVYYSSLGQRINEVSSYTGFKYYNESKGGSSFGVQTSSGTIVATNDNIYLRDNISSRVITRYTRDYFDPTKANLTYLNSSIIQNFNYVEVPVMVKYKAIEGKMDLNFIGGVSYNMLVGNSAFSYVSGEKFLIGKTDGLNSVNLSSSFSLGFEYYLWEKISLNLEPTFRYYLSPLGGMEGSSAHPYSFGIFSGISYKF